MPETVSTDAAAQLAAAAEALAKVAKATAAPAVPAAPKPPPAPPPDPLTAMVRAIRQKHFDAAQDVRITANKGSSMLRNNGRDFVGFYAVDVPFLFDVLSLMTLPKDLDPARDMDLLHRFNRKIDPGNMASERDRMVALIGQEFFHGKPPVKADVSPTEPFPEKKEEERPPQREQRTVMAPRK